VKLTIAFPTYNRSGYLRRALESVISQLGGVPAELTVALRVYDNASTDDTSAVCAELAAREPRLKFVCRPENIGGDLNILSALMDADGDFVWVFGDDDYLVAGALGPLCRLLMSSEFDVLKMGSHEERDIGGRTPAKIPERIGAITGSLNVSRFESADDILDRFGIGMGNFSSAIFGCAFFRGNYVPADPELFRSGYSQLQWIYGGLLSQPLRFGYVEDALLVLRIEMSPREVNADRVAFGLGLLRETLVRLGYPKRTVEMFFERQRDAILLGRVKSRKMSGQGVWPGLARSLAELSNVKARVKMLVIAAMPSQVYRRLWVRL
jgi:glycosyltransferase involved in cell wall biosynthesis